LPSSEAQKEAATGTDGKTAENDEADADKRTPKWTPFLTPTAFSVCNRSSSVGNSKDTTQENDSSRNCGKCEKLDSESNHLPKIGTGDKEMGRGGFEPPTHGFSVRICRL